MICSGEIKTIFNEEFFDLLIGFRNQMRAAGQLVFGIIFKNMITGNAAVLRAKSFFEPLDEGFNHKQEARVFLLCRRPLTGVKPQKAGAAGKGSASFAREAQAACQPMHAAHQVGVRFPLQFQPENDQDLAAEESLLFQLLHAHQVVLQKQPFSFRSGV